MSYPSLMETSILSNNVTIVHVLHSSLLPREWATLRNYKQNYASSTEKYESHVNNLTDFIFVKTRQMAYKQAISTVPTPTQLCNYA